MTPDERIAAVQRLGFAPRQAQFLVTVALHSGYCLRRQYEAYAGIRYGKNVRDFLDGLVEHRLAERFMGRADRGHVYHLHTRTFYRLIGQEHNRHRRQASAASIARRLMVLDYVLGRPDVAWFATEDEKVALFTEQFYIPLSDLPQRRFGPRRAAVDTKPSGSSRYFVEKHPIGVNGNPAVVSFVFLSTDGSPEAFRSFLGTHEALFRALHRWAVIIIGPSEWPDLRGVFDACVARRGTAHAQGDAELRWYFDRRRMVEQGALDRIPVQDLARFRMLRARFATPAIDRLYTAWTVDGRTQRTLFEVDQPRDDDRERRAAGALLSHVLEHRYEQFGSLPGVA